MRDLIGCDGNEGIIIKTSPFIIINKIILICKVAISKSLTVAKTKTFQMAATMPNKWEMEIKQLPGSPAIPQFLFRQMLTAEIVPL